MFADWPKWNQTSKLKERIRKGIPDGFRVGVYQLILNTKALASKADNRGIYMVQTIVVAKLAALVFVFQPVCLPIFVGVY